MHPTQLAPIGRRVRRWKAASSGASSIEFYDPDGGRYGLPTYPYHWAPDGLLTIRQLRDKGLRPGGQELAAQILWRRRKASAASPTSTASNWPCPNGRPPPPSSSAIGKALAARRTCPTCGPKRTTTSRAQPANATTAPARGHR